MKLIPLVLFAFCSLVALANASPPNVLLLLADDQRADTIGALGNEAINTPHLDRLAERGFAFTNAYCLGANMGAVCRPSRNMLLSGRVYFRWKGRNNAEADKPNLPDVLKAAGYETYHHGKKGNTADLIQARFDHNKYLANDQTARESGEHGQIIVDDAIEFLEARKSDRPFFMYLAFEGPHDPRVAAKRYLDQYERERIPLQKNFLPRHPFNNGWMEGRDERLAKWPRTEDEIRRHLHEYYACITCLDGHIGRLLTTLDDLGLTENTLIIFSSDNGLALGSHGLMGKQNVYEDGMKVPLILAGPGISPGKSDALVYLHDIFPSVCELVGAPQPEGLDGRSFGPVIRGDQNGVRDALLLAFENSQRAVRDERWKLIRYPQINKSQLFDLATDPHETRDLAGDPKQMLRVELLLNRMRLAQHEFGDEQPLTVKQPKDPSWTPPKESRGPMPSRRRRVGMRMGNQHADPATP